VFVDPLPDLQAFSRMYAKSHYHDQFYDDSGDMQYYESVLLLCKYLKPRSIVLDYGCGVGGFLKACASKDLIPFGVEFDVDAANVAAKNAKCVTMSVDAFHNTPTSTRFDAIHLGDVLEHLPNPSATLETLLSFLKPGGVLFVEGPLEVNPSPVFWAARTFGALKRILKPGFLPTNAPTHLMMTDAISQRDFFTKLDPSLRILYWQVYESGWPYAAGGIFKRTIASFAQIMGGKQIAKMTFGNRFQAVLLKNQL
jgi:2-polyprenyl-3-methyl-5-hydroxy-6-metoxy-1,4-benzoquinol methylase